MPPTKKDVDVDFNDPNAILMHVLKNITKRCQEDADNKPLPVPSNDYQARVAHYTGLSVPCIERLISNKPLVSQLDLTSRIAVLETAKSLYSNVPTYETIFKEVSNKLRTVDNEIVSDVMFLREMQTLGYIRKETVDTSVIVMEDPEVRFERFMYLLKLQKYRSNNVQWPTIVYLDERVINVSQTFKKPCRVDSFVNQTFGHEESVFYHAVSSSGLITGMFTNQATDNVFNKWLTDMVITQLKTPTVFIMDNNPLHGTLRNACLITRYHSKTEMLRWLTNNNIPCSSNMTKPALYVLIDKCKEKQKEYHIDRLIQSQGHAVLRMPRHFFDLSITTRFWDDVTKNRLIEGNTLLEIQSALMKKINSVPASTWEEYEESIKKLEKDIFAIDMAMENYSDTVYELKL